MHFNIASSGGPYLGDYRAVPTRMLNAMNAFYRVLMCFAGSSEAQTQPVW